MESGLSASMVYNRFGAADPSDWLSGGAGAMT